jgi:uncharacterized protein YdaU (DUF1376 family)
VSGNSLAMMPWFPGDFMRSTRGWSVTAKGVYRELLDAQWDMGDLPSEPAELASLIGATPTEWRAGWVKCESKFPICEHGARRNARLEAHRAKSVDLTERRQKGAAKTNAQRYGERALNGSHSERSATQSALASISDPIHLRSDPIHSVPNDPPQPLPRREGRVGGSRKFIPEERRAKTADQLEREEAAREAEGESARKPIDSQLPGGRFADR